MFKDKMAFGAAYYPEHWDKSLWRTDAANMKAAGFNVVRLAEFAWYFMEPKEGKFTFVWLDEAIGILDAAGVAVVLGTPTATVPAWLAHKYPQVMLTDKHGEQRRFGVRKDYCLNDKEFLRLSLRIVKKMAEHYAKDKRVVGFQTDNEFGGSHCRCGTCLKGFQKFLKQRYGTIEVLNQEYGAAFWGAMYSGFGEIDWPVDNANPSFALDGKRYWSQVDIDYQARQIAILRKAAPKKSITHNFMSHCCTGLDYFKLAAELDYASWDSYPGVNSATNFGQEVYGNGITWALKQKNFVVMEQQSGPGGWEVFWQGVAPGQMALLAWQSIARGADGILFFRWRTSISGQEQYWHGIINHDNVLRRRYYEVVEMGKKVHALEGKILGTSPMAEVGIYYNYDQIWSTEIQRQNAEQPVNFKTIGEELIKGMVPRGVDVGIFTDGYELGKYKVVVSPPLYLTEARLVKQLEAYVAGGGHLVLMARTGVKTANNKNVMEPLPGAYRNLAGVEVDEYTMIPKEAGWEVEIFGKRIKAERIGEHVLAGKGCEVLGVHRGGYMEGWPAVTRRKVGKGVVWYVGTLPGIEGWAAVLPEVVKGAGVVMRDDLPAGVEVARRAGHGRVLTFVLNHNATARPVAVGKGVDLMSGKKVEGEMELAGYGVAVVEQF